MASGQLSKIPDIIVEGQYAYFSGNGSMREADLTFTHLHEGYKGFIIGCVPSRFDQSNYVHAIHQYSSNPPKAWVEHNCRSDCPGATFYIQYIKS